MALLNKLMGIGIIQDKVTNALDTLSQICSLCDGEECEWECPLKGSDGTCFFRYGKNKMYQNISNLYGTSYIDNLADMLGIKVDEPFDVIINGKAEPCRLCHDGMHFKDGEESSLKLLEDIITGAVRIAK